MISIPRSVRVFACPRPIDLRKGYDGLFSLVKHALGREPLSGDLFLFVNARRCGCKVLLWDGTGLCIFMKRLERGRFAALWREDGQLPASGGTPHWGDASLRDPLQLTASELALFIEGCVLVGRQALSPKAIPV